MNSDYKNFLSRYNYKPSKFWANHNKEFKKEIAIHGIENFKESKYIMEHYSSLLNKEWAFKTAVWQYYTTIKKQDTHNILKEQKWEKIQAVEHFYNIYDNFPLIKKGNITVTICEIGGGYGELAKVFLDNLLSNFEYIIVDLPESLALAKEYLGNRKNVKYYLPNEIDKIKNVDIFINLHSFAEMTLSNIYNYLEFIDKKGKYLYSRNRDVEINKDDKIILNFKKMLPKNWKIFKEEKATTWEDFTDLYIEIKRVN